LYVLHNMGPERQMENRKMRKSERTWESEENTNEDTDWVKGGENG